MAQLRDGVETEVLSSYYVLLEIPLQSFLASLSQDIVEKLWLPSIYGSFNVQNTSFATWDVLLIILVLVFTGLSPTFWRSFRRWHDGTIFRSAPVICTLQVYLIEQSTRWSSSLGPVYGPIIAGPFLPGLLFAISTMRLFLLALALPPSDPRVVATNVIWLGFMSNSRNSIQWFRAIANSLDMQPNPLVLLHFVSFMFAVSTSRKAIRWLSMALVAISCISTFSSWSVSGINAKLSPEGYTVTERTHSTTGYISVFENSKLGYRALRCDHSLLGGEWTQYPGNVEPKLREPIYAVFVMLEAVRLIEATDTSSKAPPAEPRALIIGLGVGTSATAFIKLGIETTIVEIDPVVHRFATKYFNLPSNHTAVIGDAVDFVRQKDHKSREAYDYIIHDVFTGGAEPLELFTTDFISDLNLLLHSNGAIAINYAGDLHQSSAGAVVATAFSVFPSCRIFRETAPPAGNPKQDMANMVVFCRKTSGSYRFRDITAADTLGSHAREEHLLPQFEIPRTIFSSGKIISKSNINELAESQKINARNHWYSMRESVPGRIWETF